MDKKDNKNNPELLGDILKNITQKSIQDNAERERQKAYDISRIFQEMELNLISSMKKAFYFHQKEQEKEGFVWEQWQLSKLRAMEEFRKRNRTIVDSYSEPIQQAIDRELNDNFTAGEKRVEKVVQKAKEAGIILPTSGKPEEKPLNNLKVPNSGEKLKEPQLEASTQQENKPNKTFNPSEKSPQEQNFFGINDKKLEALQKSVTNDLNKANQAVLRKMDDVYRQTIYKAQVYMQSGTKTLNQAIDMATKDFLDKGINCIEYKDGKKVNIAGYAEMCIRTASHRATLLGEGKKRDEWDLYLVIVSAHANTCEKCLPWQGKILIDDVFSHPSEEYLKEYKDKYRLLSEAIEAGLLHPNCRHTLTTYFPGVTQIPTISDDEEALKNYTAEQEQRHMERQIRIWKRILAGSCDVENMKKASDKVKWWEDRLKDHLKENSQLRRDYEREKNRLPVDEIGDNGINDKNKYIPIPEETVAHSNKGDFSNPKNPKKQAIGKFKSGGHGQENINDLQKHGIEYNIVKEYPNGVRIGNVPSHKMPLKREGTGQAWFPKEWKPKDIEKAGEYVANLKNKSQYILEHKYINGQLGSIFKYANYKGVTVGICYDVTKRKVTTIFPDETQRMLGGNKND